MKKPWSKMTYEEKRAFDFEGPSLREQRRYEIARDCLAAERAAFFDLGYDVKVGAKEAVAAADALLAELERTDGE